MASASRLCRIRAGRCRPNPSSSNCCGCALHSFDDCDQYDQCWRYYLVCRSFCQSWFNHSVGGIPCSRCHECRARILCKANKNRSTNRFGSCHPQINPACACSFPHLGGRSNFMAFRDHDRSPAHGGDTHYWHDLRRGVCTGHSSDCSLCLCNRYHNWQHDRRASGF